MAVLAVYRTYFFLYCLTIAYGLIPLLMGEVLKLPVLFIGFGLPILLFSAVEYAGGLVMACIVGYMGRWSLVASGVLGYPLVVLVTAVAPVGEDHSALPMPLPWLATYKLEASQREFISAIENQLPVNTAVYLAALVIGLIHDAFTRRAEN